MLSIITPNLNNAKYLEDNIISISKLTIPFEHIIVDGGSTDGSLNIISKYPHVRLLHQKEKTGMYGAIHQGFTEARGEFISYINSDDRMIPEGFTAMYDYISKNKCNFIYSDGWFDFIQEKIKKFGKGRRFGKLFLRNGVMPSIQPATIYTKKIYTSVGGLRYDKFKIVGDFDLFLRMANFKDSIFKYLPVSSVIFMIRHDSLGETNEDLGKNELKVNNLPTPHFFIRILVFICRYI